MADIEYIKNLTSFCFFPAAPAAVANPEWTASLTAIPDYSPDECIVRGITFNGVVDDANCYMLWCDMHNDFLGSFNGGALVSVTPGTTFRLTSPLSNTLRFRIYMPTSTGIPAQPQAFSGDIVVHLEFRKYKRIPQRV